MATIETLVKEYSKIPGDIYIRHSPSGVIFRPFFIVEETDTAYGISSNGSTSHDADSTGWILYNEKKKIKLYKWAFDHNATWKDTSLYYQDEHSVRKDVRATNHVVRLDYTMIEVDDE